MSSRNGGGGGIKKINNHNEKQQSQTQLMALQARFQQKQLQEKEQKLLQLYDQQQQRAHQVAQRGSAGSNGSSASNNVGASAAKVKQLLASSDDRRQQNGFKGIDKSYPLDPLKSKKTSPIAKPTKSNNNNNNNNMTNRKLNSNVNVSTRRVIKADVNSNLSSSSSRIRTRQHENFSRESYVMATTTSTTSNSSTRYNSEATATNGSASGESIRQVNGHAKNGYHYEINIDDVIDNEALQRNRMLAKFQPGDIERRRRQLSGTAIATDIDDEFPVEYSQTEAATSSSRKSSLKNAKSNPQIAAAVAATKKTSTTTTTIPRASTVMKTTQSASLKVTKPPQNKNRLVLRRKSSLVRKPKKPVEKPCKKIVEPTVERCCEISERCFPPPWNTLKSTSLICEIIRKHSKLQQMRNKSKMGRVKTIVTKIENQSIIKPSTSGVPKCIPVVKSIENRLLDMTRNVEPSVPSTSHEPLDLLNANFVEALKAAESHEMVARNIENEEDRGDGLVPRNVHVEYPGDVQEVTVTIEQICPPAPRRLSAEDVNRVRRQSFEQKRQMFEQLLQHRRQRFSRHNSVESALRHFDGIDDAKKDRRSSTSSDGVRKPRGFERSTSAWTIRTSSTPKRKKSSHKKILEARDSIELTRVPVLTNLPACKKKIISQSRKSCDDDDAIKSYQRRRDSRSKSPEVKVDCSVLFGSGTSLKKADSIGKVATETKNVVTPYPSSRSPDGSEKPSRSVVKSTSLKLLSKFAGSNGDVDSIDHLPRKSSIHTLENDEKLPAKAPITPAPRTSPSSSSNLLSSSRSQGSRPTNATTGKKTPTPAARTTAPSSANADDSLITCKICTRRFQSERIVKHEQICAKTAQKKRKQFDAVGHRVRGTELESFVQKPNKKGKAAVAASTSTVKPESQKSNWRRKHEDFINAIRSAKQMQAHLAAGGKLSDLPPPPPTDTSDYVQCPHCSRKFNQGVAERHIPKCETMQHNKPKPRPKR